MRTSRDFRAYLAVHDARMVRIPYWAGFRSQTTGSTGWWLEIPRKQWPSVSCPARFFDLGSEEARGEGEKPAASLLALGGAWRVPQRFRYDRSLPFSWLLDRDSVQGPGPARRLPPGPLPHAVTRGRIVPPRPTPLIDKVQFVICTCIDGPGKPVTAGGRPGALEGRPSAVEFSSYPMG